MKQSAEENSVRRRLIRAALSLMIAIVLVTSVGCPHIYRTAACKQRGAAYSARYDKLKQDAHEQLKIGTKKEALVRFFESNGIPVSFIGDEATGTIKIVGCAPFGCGTDDGILGLKVKVDKEGTVAGEPS